MAIQTHTLTISNHSFTFSHDGAIQLTALDGQTYKPGASIVGGGTAWPSVSNGTTTMTLKTMTLKTMTLKTMTLKTMTGLTVQKGWTVSLGGHRSLTFTYTYN